MGDLASELKNLASSTISYDANDTLVTRPTGPSGQGKKFSIGGGHHAPPPPRGRAPGFGKGSNAIPLGRMRELGGGGRSSNPPQTSVSFAPPPNFRGGPRGGAGGPPAPHMAMRDGPPAQIAKKPRRMGRKSRWDRTGAKTAIPGVPTHIPADVPEDVVDALLLRVRIEEITSKLTSGNPLGDHSVFLRSPSPPPEYDREGKRLNTREVRARRKLTVERQLLIQEATSISPIFMPPPDYRPVSLKKVRKIRIPVDKYPDYNFIGLIIGPRGDTHKQMERDSGAKIAIRGKGSVKDGKHNPQGEEDLHVLITADTDAQMKKASKMVEKLLIPMDDAHNEHKQLQLRKLADYNGTLRTYDRFSNHRVRRFQAGKEVYCTYCGEVSHPTADCPLKAAGAVSKLDQEYDSFLSAIGSSSNPEGASPADDKLLSEMDKFMASVNSTPAPPPPPHGNQPPPPPPPHGGGPYGGPPPPYGRPY